MSPLVAIKHVIGSTIMKVKRRENDAYVKFGELHGIYIPGPGKVRYQGKHNTTESGLVF